MVLLNGSDVKFQIAIVISLLTLVSGCHSTPHAARPSGHIEHVVLMWLKIPGDDAARDRLIETSEGFRQVPGVLDVSYGTAIPSERPIVDATFDLGVVVTLTDKDAMSAFLANPIHVAAVQDVVVPLVERTQVYDIQTP
jgi:hypothetical protein